jgi:hypothetical protein
LVAGLSAKHMPTGYRPAAKVVGRYCRSPGHAHLRVRNRSLAAGAARSSPTASPSREADHMHLIVPSGVSFSASRLARADDQISGRRPQPRLSARDRRRMHVTDAVADALVTDTAVQFMQKMIHHSFRKPGISSWRLKGLESILWGSRRRLRQRSRLLQPFGCCFLPTLTPSM